MKTISIIIYAIFVTLASNAIERTTPHKAGMDSIRLTRIDDVINASINNNEIPGAVCAVVRNGKLAYIKAYGNRRVLPSIEPMTENTIFDLASISKSVGTAMSMAHLLERGGFRLKDRVDMYIPNFRPWRDSVTGQEVHIRIIDLMTHSSGLPAYVDPKSLGEGANADSLINYICRTKRNARPTTKFTYSCLNFITLQHVLQNITGMRLCDYAQKNIFDPLGMKNTAYTPLETRPDLVPLIAPTERQADGSVLCAEVHDGLARIINKGNSGNAGVFSNAEDLAIIATALINRGNYNGIQILAPLTVATMTTVPQEVVGFGRSLGWDNYSAYSSNLGDLFPRPEAFGHGGYTGTSLTIDPVSKTAVILLTNRVHPQDTGKSVRLSNLIANIVAASIVD